MRQIAGSGALIGVTGKLQLPTLHHVGGIGKCRADVPSRVILQIGVHGGIPTRMIEMEMGIDDPFHVPGQEAGRRQGVLQLSGTLESLVLHPVDVEELAVLLVAECCIDQHQSITVFDQDAAHGERNAIPLIRLDTRTPERSRYHPEHGTSIEALEAALEGMATQAADLKGKEQAHISSGQESARGSVGIARRFRRTLPVRRASITVRS